MSVISLVLKHDPLKSADATQVTRSNGTETMFFFLSRILIVENYSLISNADKARASTLAIEDRVQCFTGNNVRLYPLELILLVVIDLNFAHLVLTAHAVGIYFHQSSCFC